MDNKSKNQKEESLFNKIKIPLIIFIVGLTLVFALLKIFNLTDRAYFNSDATIAESLNPESFQAPAEISSEIQIECQNSAEKIESIANCDNQQTEYLNHVQTCLNAQYATDNSEGKFGDLVFKIASCYIADNNKDKALTILQKAQSFGSWDIYTGPISCDSDVAIAAWTESLNKENTFACVAKNDLNGLISDLQSQNFTTLDKTLFPAKILQFGILDSDVSCPDSYKKIKGTLQSLYKQNIKAELMITDDQSIAKEAGLDKVYINLSKDNQQMGLLKFSLNSENCLVFESLLLTNSESQ